MLMLFVSLVFFSAACNDVVVVVATKSNMQIEYFKFSPAIRFGFQFNWFSIFFLNSTLLSEELICGTEDWNHYG